MKKKLFCLVLAFLFNSSAIAMSCAARVAAHSPLTYRRPVAVHRENEQFYAVITKHLPELLRTEYRVNGVSVAVSELGLRSFFERGLLFPYHVNEGDKLSTSIYGRLMRTRKSAAESPAHPIELVFSNQVLASSHRYRFISERYDGLSKTRPLSSDFEMNLFKPKDQDLESDLIPFFGRNRGETEVEFNLSEKQGPEGLYIEHLDHVLVEDKIRSKILKNLRTAGMTTINGKPLEEVVRSRTQTQAQKVSAKDPAADIYFQKNPSEKTHISAHLLAVLQGQEGYNSLVHYTTIDRVSAILKMGELTHLTAQDPEAQKGRNQVGNGGRVYVNLSQSKTRSPFQNPGSYAGSFAAVGNGSYRTKKFEKVYFVFNLAALASHLKYQISHREGQYGDYNPQLDFLNDPRRGASNLPNLIHFFDHQKAGEVIFYTEEMGHGLSLKFLEQIWVPALELPQLLTKLGEQGVHHINGRPLEQVIIPVPFENVSRDPYGYIFPN